MSGNQASPETVRSRRVRERILHMLVAAHRGCPDVGIDHGEILKAFAGDRARYSPADVQAELIDLIDDGLITQHNAPWGGDLPEKIYQVTSQGRDFQRAGFPWGRIDEYTGGQTLGG